MKSLNEDLKTGQLKQIYLLYGEEAYLKKQYKDKLHYAIVPPDDTMNYAYYEGKGINAKEVIDLAETLPFFAERRLIILENSGFFKNASPELSDYIKELPETTSMIFVESEIDKRGKLYKAVKDKGRVVELGRQDESTLLRWIAGSVRRENKQITEQVIRFFLTKVGTDMENIQRELEKLFCYTLDKSEITAQDVEEICTTQITNQIFDMVNAVAEKQQRKALDMDKRGYPRKEIASKVGLHPFVVGKYQEQARAFSSKALREIIEDSVDMEEAVKTGRLSDMLGVELFIMKYSAK